MDLYSVNEIYELLKNDDKTPNEKRFLKNDEIDDFVFYPFANIYNRQLPIFYSKDLNEKYITLDSAKETLVKNQLKYAVTYLQVNALKKFISFNPETNLYLQLFTCCKYPYENNKQAYYDILNILALNYDNPITKIRTAIYKNEINDELLCYTYNSLHIDESNICKYCLITEPSYQLIKPCNCDAPVHIDCLKRWFGKISDRDCFRNFQQLFNKKENCEICKCSYKIGVAPHGCFSFGTQSAVDKILFFPSLDMYPLTLSSCNELITFNGINRLNMAIDYLQVDRVKELLQEKDILENINEGKLCGLCFGNVGNNYMIHLGDNQNKYLQIIKLLLDTNKINVNKKTTFEKSLMDHAVEKNYDDIVQLLKTKSDHV